MFKTSLRAVSLLILFHLITFPLNFCLASEVLEETNTQILIREHPKTGKPYVSITKKDVTQALLPESQKFSRPDYRMLDPKVRSGEIPYDGPYSSSKKVYIFAATLATLGTVGGAVGIAAIPATGSVAASGGGAYLAGGAAIAAGTAGAAVLKTKTDSKEDDFIQETKSESKLNAA